MTFVDKGISRVAVIIRIAYVQWELASRRGLFQAFDPRLKLLFLLFFAVIVSLQKDVTGQLLCAGFFAVLVLASRLGIWDFYSRVLLLGFVFGFLLALPSVLNVFNSGEVIVPLLRFDGPRRFWIYSLPPTIGITAEGLRGASILTLRVINSLTVSLLVVFTTPFTEIVRALKVFRIPDALLMVITLTYKYIFLFARTVEDMHLAKKSRLTGPVGNAEGRRWIAGRIAFIFRRTQLRCEEVFKAMRSRGFSDDVRVYGFKAARPTDWAAGIAFVLIGFLILLRDFFYKGF